jgi:xylulose-5-phosphate/fructose-6-phosphate phosphoketolase
MNSPVATCESPALTDDSGVPDSQRALGSGELRRMDAYWRAANYLSVGQIYLYDNPVARAPDAGTCEAAAGRTLGHYTWPELHLSAFEPGH